MYPPIRDMVGDLKQAISKDEAQRQAMALLSPVLGLSVNMRDCEEDITVFLPEEATLIEHDRCMEFDSDYDECVLYIMFRIEAQAEHICFMELEYREPFEGIIDHNFYEQLRRSLDHPLL